MSITDRTKLRRKPQRGSHDPETIHAVLDEALVCHVAFMTEHGPVVLPTAFVRVGDHVYLHGSAASHMLRSLTDGRPVSIAVTLVDALVLARTAFHHSMNYRSVVVFGRGREVTDTAEKLHALGALIDRMAPNRSAASRPANAKELAATLVVAIPIEEASAKARSGPPLPDDGEDATLPYWAGVIPLVTTRGEPITSPDCTMPY